MIKFLKYFLLIFFSIPFGHLTLETEQESKCQMDTFQLRTSSKLNQSNELEIYYQSQICYKCSLLLLGNLGDEFYLGSTHGYTFEVKKKGLGDTLCELNDRHFGECGVYLLEFESNEICDIKTVKNPIDSSVHLLQGFVVYLLFIILCVMIEKKCDMGKEKNRIDSLDAFRGFSLALMIFVNYGSGGYYSLKHAVWHGITLAGMN